MIVDVVIGGRTVVRFTCINVVGLVVDVSDPLIVVLIIDHFTSQQLSIEQWWLFVDQCRLFINWLASGIDLGLAGIDLVNRCALILQQRISLRFEQIVFVFKIENLGAQQSGFAAAVGVRLAAQRQDAQDCQQVKAH